MPRHQKPLTASIRTVLACLLALQVTLVIYLAALMSFVGWFIFSIYVGIGFIALPMDCFNAFIHRPKLLSLSEARQQKKVLMTRAKELLEVGRDMGSRMIDFSDDMHSKKERRKQSKIDAQEMNRFRVLVDMLEHDLEEFQLSDPQNYKVSRELTATTCRIASRMGVIVVVDAQAAPYPQKRPLVWVPIDTAILSRRSTTTHSCRGRSSWQASSLSS